MFSRILSEDPVVQGMRLISCLKCSANHARIEKLAESAWKITCSCGNKAESTSPSKTITRWNANNSPLAIATN